MKMRFLPTQKKEWRFFFIRWMVIMGILMSGLLFFTNMPGDSYSGEFFPLSGEEMQVQYHIREYTEMLGKTIGERNVWYYDELNAAADYITEKLESFGYTVQTQTYEAEKKLVKNIEAELAGTTRPREIIIVGAHYDSVIGSPGANDNGSGVAAVIEIARLLAHEKLPRTIRFVTFVNEEPPFFMTEKMGSWVYTARSRQRNENIVAMVSLETIGCYSDKPGTQEYPFPFSQFYPDTGNFIGFVSNLSSQRLLKQAISSFRTHTKFPSEGLTAPGWMSGVGWSDQWAFWKHGYPGFMVTDTAMFRYKYYHTAEDTPDKMNFERMARVVAGMARVIRDIAR